METITLTRSTAPRKDQRLVIYNIEGRKGSVQFLSTLFGSNQTAQGNPLPTLTLTGVFAPPPKKETPEERKARLAAITPEQRIKGARSSSTGGESVDRLRASKAL